MRKPEIRFVRTLVLVLLLAACGSPSTGTTPASDVNGRTTVPASAPTIEAAAARVASSTKKATTVEPSAVTQATPASVSTAPAVVSPTVAATSPDAETATVKPREGSQRAVTVADFGMVAYQGEDLLGGRQAQFSQVFKQGKPVVLNFWAGNCPPCRFEMPSFQAVADRYEGRVVFVGVDVGIFTGLGSHESARQLLDELDIRYPSAYAVDASSLQQYNVVNMPTTIFFDAQGRVTARRAGIVTEDDLQAVVDQLVAGS